jgi:hypothetical protein
MDHHIQYYYFYKNYIYIFISLKIIKNKIILNKNVKQLPMRLELGKVFQFKELECIY